MRVEAAKRRADAILDVTCNEAGTDTCRMVAEEGLPGLRPPSPTPRHVLGHRRLRDFDAELQQLTMNAGRTPQSSTGAASVSQKRRTLDFRFVPSATAT